MVIIRITQYKGRIRGRSTENSRIERFWRGHNVSVMAHFNNKFEKLETLGFLDANSNTDTWVMHCVRMTIINQSIG